MILASSSRSRIARARANLHCTDFARGENPPSRVTRISFPLRHPSSLSVSELQRTEPRHRYRRRSIATMAGARITIRLEKRIKSRARPRGETHGDRAVKGLSPCHPNNYRSTCRRPAHGGGAPTRYPRVPFDPERAIGRSRRFQPPSAGGR